MTQNKIFLGLEILYFGARKKSDVIGHVLGADNSLKVEDVAGKSKSKINRIPDFMCSPYK